MGRDGLLGVVMVRACDGDVVAQEARLVLRQRHAGSCSVREGRHLYETYHELGCLGEAINEFVCLLFRHK